MSVSPYEYNSQRHAAIMAEAKKKYGDDYLSHLFLPGTYGSWGGGTGIVIDRDYLELSKELAERERNRNTRKSLI